MSGVWKRAGDEMRRREGAETSRARLEPHGDVPIGKAVRYVTTSAANDTHTHTLSLSLTHTGILVDDKKATRGVQAVKYICPPCRVAKYERLPRFVDSRKEKSAARRGPPPPIEYSVYTMLVLAPPPSDQFDGRTRQARHE